MKSVSNSKLNNFIIKMDLQDKNSENEQYNIINEDQSGTNITKDSQSGFKFKISTLNYKT